MYLCATIGLQDFVHLFQRHSVAGALNHYRYIVFNIINVCINVCNIINATQETPSSSCKSLNSLNKQINKQTMQSNFQGNGDRT